MTWHEQVLKIEAYCNDCHRLMVDRVELFFINYKNKVTSIVCEECFKKYCKRDAEFILKPNTAKGEPHE